MKKIKKKYYFYFPVYLASILSWMVQGAVSKKRKNVSNVLKEKKWKNTPVRSHYLPKSSLASPKSLNLKIKKKKNVSNILKVTK
jgi:hypothetical protein